MYLLYSLQFYGNDGVCDFLKQKKKKEKDGQGFDDKVQGSGPQPFWHQGPVSWKTIFPLTGWGRGGWFRL